MSTTPSPSAEVSTDEEVLGLAARVFALRFEAGLSLGAIAGVLRAGGTSISSETVRKILLGERHAAITESLRRRYPTYVARVVEELQPADYEAIFAAFHDEKRSLSSIAADYEGWDYSRVRRVLVGDGEYAEPTAELRARFPLYVQRTGRRARVAPPQRTITEVFKLYFDKRLSLTGVQHRTGVPKGAVKALIEGRLAPEKTAALRVRYGDTVRPDGAPSGERWYQARGLDPAAVG